MSNKDVRKEDNPWKIIIIVVICNYVVAGILHMFTKTTEGEIWLMVLWPIIGFVGYAAIMILRELDRPTPVIIKNPEAMKSMNTTNMKSSNEQNSNINKELENEKQKVKDLTLLVESKDILITHMQKEIEVYQHQVAELIKKI